MSLRNAQVGLHFGLGGGGPEPFTKAAGELTHDVIGEAPGARKQSRAHKIKFCRFYKEFERQVPSSDQQLVPGEDPQNRRKQLD
jgi:hypothetical protein